MPRLSNSTPKYCKHSASGQAYVSFNGQQVYLGPHGSATSKREYDRLVGEWMAAGRTMPSETATVTVTELCIDYTRKCDWYYRKNGKPTREHATAKRVLKELRAVYGKTIAIEFGPIAFKAFRDRYMKRKLCRNTINRYLIHVLGAFRLGVENEKIQSNTWHDIKAVERLRKGRSKAPESKRVSPVDPILVNATIPFLPAIVAAMVRLQLATAMRPSEVCIVRPDDIDRSGDIWIFTPHTHKTEHHDRPRIIPFGTTAQNILRPYLLRDENQFCFSPAETVEQVRRQRHLDRKTPLSCGNVPGSKPQKRNPKRAAGNCYTTMTYGRTIKRACIANNLPKWAPNQLRKLAATNIRRFCDLEAAQVILGHSSKAVTEAYYADPNIAAAVEVARKIG